MKWLGGFGKIANFESSSTMTKAKRLETSLSWVNPPMPALLITLFMFRYVSWYHPLGPSLICT